MEEQKFGTALPSRWKPEDKVSVVFTKEMILKDCEIVAVKFDKMKVYYDIAVIIVPETKTENKDDYNSELLTLIDNVDGTFVYPR